MRSLLVKGVVADRSKGKGKDPEVVIPIKPTPHVTAMAASDMATKGSESEEEGKKKKAMSPEESPTNLLIWSVDQWLEKRTKEVEMIDSFLKRGFDWPLQPQL